MQMQKRMNEQASASKRAEAMKNYHTVSGLFTPKGSSVSLAHLKKKKSTADK
jgi:hypothetical protein